MSGPISIGDLKTTFVDLFQNQGNSLSDYYGITFSDGSAPASGTISLGDFRGKTPGASGTPPYTITGWNDVTLIDTNPVYFTFQRTDSAQPAVVVNVHAPTVSFSFFNWFGVEGGSTDHFLRNTISSTDDSIKINPNNLPASGEQIRVLIAWGGPPTYTSNFNFFSFLITYSPITYTITGRNNIILTDNSPQAFTFQRTSSASPPVVDTVYAPTVSYTITDAYAVGDGSVDHFAYDSIYYAADSIKINLDNPPASGEQINVVISYSGPYPSYTTEMTFLITYSPTTYTITGWNDITLTNSDSQYFTFERTSSTAVIDTVHAPTVSFSFSFWFGVDGGSPDHFLLDSISSTYDSIKINAGNPPNPGEQIRVVIGWSGPYQSDFAYFSFLITYSP